MELLYLVAASVTRYRKIQVQRCPANRPEKTVGNELSCQIRIFSKVFFWCDRYNCKHKKAQHFVLTDYKTSIYWAPATFAGQWSALSKPPNWWIIGDLGDWVDFWFPGDWEVQKGRKWSCIGKKSRSPWTIDIDLTWMVSCRHGSLCVERWNLLKDRFLERVTIRVAVCKMLLPVTDVGKNRFNWIVSKHYFDWGRVVLASCIGLANRDSSSLG